MEGEGVGSALRNYESSTLYAESRLTWNYYRTHARYSRAASVHCFPDLRSAFSFLDIFGLPSVEFGRLTIHDPNNEPST